MHIPLDAPGCTQPWWVILENMQPKPSLAGAVSLPGPGIHPYHKQQPPLPREAPPLIRINHEYTNPYLGHLQHRHLPEEGNGLLCWSIFWGSWKEPKPGQTGNQLQRPLEANLACTVNCKPGNELCPFSLDNLWSAQNDLVFQLCFVQGDLWKILCGNWRLFFCTIILQMVERHEEMTERWA